MVKSIVCKLKPHAPWIWPAVFCLLAGASADARTRMGAVTSAMAAQGRLNRKVLDLAVPNLPVPTGGSWKCEIVDGHEILASSGTMTLSTFYFHTEDPKQRFLIPVLVPRNDAIVLL